MLDFHYKYRHHLSTLASVHFFHCSQIKQSAAIIRHSMSIVQQKPVHYLNPGQIPDQPLYAIAKQIQWT